ncbi:MAG: STAS/SEC14 domain-containing protein [Myxococcales bacterium]|nr:STAS/SEC14 domain-containing protein [Myxococcales bacterium]
MSPRDLFEQTKTQRIYWDSDHEIVFAEMLPVAHDADDARTNISAQAKLRDSLGRKQTRILVDMRNVGKMTSHARKVYAAPEAASVQRAAALVIKSRFGAMMANLFIPLSKPISPTRMFTREQDALAWLEQFPAD